MWQIAWAIVAVWLLTANAVTAALFLIDKRAAAHGKRRISESTLLTWAMLGGWPAAILVGRLIRHKTAKHSFRLKFALAAFLNLSVLVAIGVMVVR